MFLDLIISLSHKQYYGKRKLQLITANVGDSRAVLCRAGKAVRLSEDHKPDRRDERARIEGVGGSVLQIGSSWRCTKGKEWGNTRFKIPESQILLSTSRALGDREEMTTWHLLDRHF